MPRTKQNIVPSQDLLLDKKIKPNNLKNGKHEKVKKSKKTITITKRHHKREAETNADAEAETEVPDISEIERTSRRKKTNPIRLTTSETDTSMSTRERMSGRQEYKKVLKRCHKFIADTKMNAIPRSRIKKFAKLQSENTDVQRWSKSAINALHAAAESFVFNMFSTNRTFLERIPQKDKNKGLEYFNNVISATGFNPEERASYEALCCHIDDEIEDDEEEAEAEAEAEEEEEEEEEEEAAVEEENDEEIVA